MTFRIAARGSPRWSPVYQAPWRIKRMKPIVKPTLNPAIGSSQRQSRVVRYSVPKEAREELGGQHKL